MMRIIGLMLFLGGGIILLTGALVCITTLRSDYASSACQRAARDEKAFSEARALCGSPTTDLLQAGNRRPNDPGRLRVPQGVHE